jgi:mannose-6-phosphate isomerase-like protein (cupin superfamily)
MGTLIKFAQLPSIPYQNENQRMVRVVFVGSTLGSRCLLTYENSAYFAQGRSPAHSDDTSEEIIYFRRGTGVVQLDAQKVSVKAGNAVGVPRSRLHCVVNPEKDFMEHWLLGADISRRRNTFTPPRIRNGRFLVVPGPETGLECLSCRQLELELGKAGEAEAFEDHESVYAVNAGCGIVQVSTPDGKYSWEYAIDSSTAFWLPAKTQHCLRNTGDCTMVLTGFHASVGAP